MAGAINVGAIDTIAALATPPGRGGVGIIRISGPATTKVAEALLGKLPKPRTAEYLPFIDRSGQSLDVGLALYFPAPHSFTGEDVLELHGHGGPVLMDMVLREVLQQGVRMARAGEFSERAFLNDKLDLAQAEAIADLIEAGSEQAARSAMRSLQGAFSEQIHVLVEDLTLLRMHVEAAIDFPEEEIDFLADERISRQLGQIQQTLNGVMRGAEQGCLIQEGLQVVLAGQPNVGKSSLLNALSGRETAIVTEIAGTTRDVLREQIHIDGMPLHIIDTAGLRESRDIVEQEGIRRTWGAIEQADVVLLLVDMQAGVGEVDRELLARLPAKLPRLVVENKSDLMHQPASIVSDNSLTHIKLSAKTGDGLGLLRDHLKSLAGYQNVGEGGFSARRRHLEAIARADQHLQMAATELEHRQGELMAEELRLAQQVLSEITGQVTSEDLLGRIFASFCIGK